MSLHPEMKEPERVMELWFDDADVVFQAGQKLFRVHRSILSARSPIFRDMFSIPLKVPELAASETVDGCTLIHLPDAAEQIIHFFLAIFDSSSFEPPPSVPVPFVPAVAAILHLSHKYEVGFLRRRAISHLNRIFPTDMDSPFLKSHLTDGARAGIFQIIEPAYTADVRWIIPSAFLWTVQMKLETIFKNAHWINLPPHIQELYLIFREQYHRDRDQVASWLLSIPQEDCETPKRCQKSARFYILAYRNVVEKSERQLLTQSHLASKFCTHCTAFAFTQSIATLKKRWDGFPTVLGLPDWATLLKEKAEWEIPTIST